VKLGNLTSHDFVCERQTHAGKFQALFEVLARERISMQKKGFGFSDIFSRKSLEGILKNS